MTVWYEEMDKKSFAPSLKLEEGVHVVEVVGDPKIIEIPDFNDRAKLVKKAVFPVKYGEANFAWFVQVSYLTDKQGKPKDTLFAQLAALAKTNNGITGAVLKVTVVGQGKRRFYRVELK